jgi:TRAP-type C4-dicarboxylate transport system permease small subunit
MDRFIDAYVRFLVFLSVLALVAMVALVFGNVVLRYGFNSGITVSEELSRWMFVWLVFLGAVVAVREHSHLGVDALMQRLSPASRRSCAALGHVLMLVCAAIFLAGSWKQAVINLPNAAPASGLSMAWLYGAGVVFGASVIPLLLVELLATLTGRRPDEDLVIIREAEHDIAALQRAHGGVQAP